jgi:hypothetical protein
VSTGSAVLVAAYVACNDLLVATGQNVFGEFVTSPIIHSKTFVAACMTTKLELGDTQSIADAKVL